MTIRDLVRAARARLVSAGVERREAAMDAELLAREVLGWDRARFIAGELDVPPEPFHQPFEVLLARRSRREPISEILGRREFWGLEFEVTPDVLTPRPETELIVEEALARIAVSAHPRVADVGTGTGCLAVTLAHERPLATLVATDISTAALAVARRNAARHGVLDRVDFRHASLLDGVAGSLDLVVSNPPYIPTADLAGLPPEVRDHEPRQALDGGPDGLDAVRALAGQASAALAPGAWLIVEFGYGQEARVAVAVAEAGLDLVSVRPDLQGIARTVIARKPSAG
jgi:release factor glutamine methyltransferase